MSTQERASDLNWFENLILFFLRLMGIAYLIMLAVPAFGGPLRFGYLDYLTGAAGFYGFLRLVRLGLK
jgi:hypothetical protein